MRCEFAHVSDAIAEAARACGIDGTTLVKRVRSPEPVAPPAPVIAPSDLSDSEWALLRPFFDTNEKRKNKAPSRRYLSGAFYQRTTRCRFSHIPRRYCGNGSAALRKHLERWAHTGVWASVLEALEADRLQELTPERRRALLSLAREWAGRGAKYAANRE